jgi:hypothetical protein
MNIYTVVMPRSSELSGRIKKTVSADSRELAEDAVEIRNDPERQGGDEGGGGDR